MAGQTYTPAIEQPSRRGWTDWIRPKRRGYRMACCDCGLVHEVNFRLDGRHVEYQARRHPGATRARRRKGT
jgi:hypothetical protein